MAPRASHLPPRPNERRSGCAVFGPGLHADACRGRPSCVVQIKADPFLLCSIEALKRLLPAVAGDRLIGPDKGSMLAGL